MILYIEDNVAIAENVIDYLEVSGYTVKWIVDGAVGLEEALSGWYSCIILDLMLPSMDGFAICREVRKKKNTPIIMTTAKGTLDDKGFGFAEGADDYLVKPFALEELVMRIDALLKRSATTDNLTFGDIEVLIEENRCIKNGEEIHVTSKERQLLILLVDEPYMVTRRSDIAEVLWGHDALFDDNNNTIDVYIANLRKKLGKGFIETVKGVGYRIAV